MSLTNIRLTPQGIEVGMPQEAALAILDGQGPAPKTWWEFQNLSAALWLRERTEEALFWANVAFEAQRAVSTCINMAVILESLARLDEALVYARMAYQTDPTDERAAQCYGEHLLRQGFFSAGWVLYCQARANDNFSKLQDLLPEWTGQDLKSKRLLIVGYGGYGDNFYFMHMFPKLREMGADITYAGHPPIQSIVEHQGYKVARNLQDRLDFKFYDYYSTIFSLGMKLDWSLTNPLWPGPYIRAPRSWRLRWGIGVCFQAGEASSPRKTRNMSFSQRTKIVRAVGDRIVDFTYTKFTNWLDTAKALSRLDLLVTVDTGVAHLAGAMGIPVWVILPGASAWHYPVGYTYHPFYPTMRLFWSQHEGMDDAVDDCVKALQWK